MEGVIDERISCHCHQPIRLSTGRQTSEPSVTDYKLFGKESRDRGFCVGVVAHDLAPLVDGHSSLRVALHEAVHRCLITGIWISGTNLFRYVGGFMRWIIGQRKLTLQMKWSTWLAAITAICVTLRPRRVASNTIDPVVLKTKVAEH